MMQAVQEGGCTGGAGGRMRQCGREFGKKVT